MTAEPHSLRKSRFMKALKPSLSGLLFFLCGVELLGAQQTVPIFVSGHDRAYEALSSEASHLMTVRGPGELRLVTRARFLPSTANGLSYSLRVRVDGGAEQEVLYENVERSRTAMFRDGTLGVPGRLMDYVLPLRRGYHNIEISSGPDSPPILFRTLFKPIRERRRQWVALTPLGEPSLVELVVRESLVSYYRNPPGKPFEVEVIGPTELRVFTRVDCTPEMRGRIHYRLQVRENERVINTFQLSSRRSEVAVYRAFDALVPSRATEIVIPIPPGHHRLQISPMDPDKSTVLSRFLLPKDDLALTVD